MNNFDELGEIQQSADSLDCGDSVCSLTAGLLRSSSLECADAFEAIEAFFERHWTDGLPVVPPTTGRVAAFLDVCALSPEEVIARIPTRDNTEITAEKLAINAVMSGAKPEYMPVILAGMRALGNPKNNLHTHTATASGAGFLTIVNGPIVDELGINRGRGLFGPGNRASATIGRALRLTIQNVARSVQGEFDQAIWSTPGRYTWCFGETKATGPNWPTNSEDKGFNANDSTVTIYPYMRYRAMLSPTSKDPNDWLKALGYSGRFPSPLAGGPEDTGNPVLFDLPDMLYGSAVNNEFETGRTHLFVLGLNCQRILGDFSLDEVKQRIFQHMTEDHQALRPIPIQRPELVSVVCVDVEGDGYVFIPHAPTNEITEKVVQSLF